MVKSCKISIFHGFNPLLTPGLSLGFSPCFKSPGVVFVEALGVVRVDGVLAEVRAGHHGAVPGDRQGGLRGPGRWTGAEGGGGRGTENDGFHDGFETLSVRGYPKNQRTTRKDNHRTTLKWMVNIWLLYG